MTEQAKAMAQVLFDHGYGSPVDFLDVVDNDEASDALQEAYLRHSPDLMEEIRLAHEKAGNCGMSFVGHLWTITVIGKHSYCLQDEVNAELHKLCEALA